MVARVGNSNVEWADAPYDHPSQDLGDVNESCKPDMTRKFISQTSSGIHMPTCQSCGSSVAKQYIRVFTPDELENPRVCPHC